MYRILKKQIMYEYVGKDHVKRAPFKKQQMNSYFIFSCLSFFGACAFVENRIDSLLGDMRFLLLNFPYKLQMKCPHEILFHTHKKNPSLTNSNNLKLVSCEGE